MFHLAGKSVWVTGHTGMVGQALCRRLAREDCEILTATRGDVDLRCQREVEHWITSNYPDVIIVAAATVGGILPNQQQPAPFLYDNLMIAANLVHAAYRTEVKKLLFLGSSCIYPRLAKQPLTEDSLLTGPLEPTNQWYAVAKIAGVKLCQAYRRQYGCDFISAMPTNLYGPGDRFDPELGHVIPGLIARMHAAKISQADRVEIWGTGTPRREFLHVDDLADACVHLLKHYSDDAPINVGYGCDFPIFQIAQMIQDVVGFQGVLVLDISKPDGTPQKLLDSSLLESLGWSPRIALHDGLRQTYDWYLEHAA